MKPLAFPPAAECASDDLEQIALSVAGAHPTIDPGDLGPGYVEALCRLVTTLSIARAEAMNLATERGRAWRAATDDSRALQLKLAAVTNERDRLQDEIARVNNLRQAEVLDAAEQRERADNAEAVAEVRHMAAQAALALVTRPGAVEVDELVRAIDGRLSRALVREQEIARAYSRQWEEALRQLDDLQQTQAHNARLQGALTDACAAVTGKSIERVNLELDKERHDHPDAGPLHHARDQRESEDDASGLRRTVHLYKCSGPSCPGYIWPASSMPHPATCNAAPDQRDHQEDTTP